MTLPGAVPTRPASLDELIGIVQREYPAAGIRITGRARTIRRQAELMAERIRANRAEFLETYSRGAHIREMDRWVQQYPDATVEQTTVEFERIIRVARQHGAVVSRHLSDTARDISWPQGSDAEVSAIDARIRALGARVLREPNAAGGRHWHVDW